VYFKNIKLRIFRCIFVCFVLVGSLSAQQARDVPIREMSNQLLIAQIQERGVGNAIDLVKELLERLEKEENVTPELNGLKARIYFEVSLFYYNAFVLSASPSDLNECIDYGQKLRKEFPSDPKALESLDFEVNGRLSLRAWEEARTALKEGMDGIDAGIYPPSKKREWLSNTCLVYAVLEEWSDGEPYFINQFKSLSSSVHDRALAAIYLIRTYESAETPEEALQYIPVLSDAKDDRWDAELNLSLFKLGNQFSDEAEYSKANYLYFKCLTLEDIAEFYEGKVLSLKKRMEWYQNREVPVPPELDGEVESLESYVKALKNQQSYTAPLKYARARNLERMGRSFDSFFAYLRLVREHPEHSYAERYHFTAFNQSIEIGYSVYSIELGEAYLANSAYDTYWREVSVKLMSLYFELENYDRVLALGKDFMSKDPTHAYGSHVVHFMAFSWMRLEDFASLRETLNFHLDAHPMAPLSESAHYWLGLADVVEQAFNEAIVHFDFVVENFSSGNFYVESRFRRGVCEFGLGDYEAAKLLFTEWIDSYPTNHLRGEGEGFLGDIAASEAKIERALEHYSAVDQYTKRMSLVDHAYFESARLLEANGRFQDMVERLNLYMSKYQDDGNLARAIFRIGQAYESLGQPEIMLESYFAAIIRYGDNPLAEGVDEIFLRFSEKYYKFKNIFESTAEFVDGLLSNEIFRLEIMADRKALHLYRMEHTDVDRDLIERLLRDDALRIGLSSRELPLTEEQQLAGVAPLVDNSIQPEAKQYLDERLAYFSERIEGYPPVAPEQRFRELFQTASSSGQRTLELRLLVAFDELGIDAPGDAKLVLKDLSAASPATLGWIARKQLNEDARLAEQAARQVLVEYPESLAAPDAHIVLAELIAEAGDLNAALERFDFVRENYPTWPKSAVTAIRAGDLCFAAGEYDKALERYLYVLQVRDWRGKAWAQACLQIGECYEKTGEMMKAHGFYERTYLTYRQFAEWTARALYNDALLLEGLNEIQSAKNLYSQYLELPEVNSFPNHDEVKKRLKSL